MHSLGNLLFERQHKLDGFLFGLFPSVRENLQFCDNGVRFTETTRNKTATKILSFDQISDVTLDVQIQLAPNNAWLSTDYSMVFHPTDGDQKRSISFVFQLQPSQSKASKFGGLGGWSRERDPIGGDGEIEGYIERLKVIIGRRSGI